MSVLLDKLETLISKSENLEDAKNTIINNKYYNKLNEEEKELILEETIEKYNEKYNNLNKSNKSNKSSKKTSKKIKTKETENNIINEPTLICHVDISEMTEGEIMSSREKAILLREPTFEEYTRRAEIFNETKILSANMPAQKSEGWHLNRVNRVGGSECGTLLNMNKHEPQYSFILNKVLGATFKGNYATYNGNVFEEVVRLMYEYNNDVHTEEFSSMPHKTNPIIAASPDGIVSPYCRDKQTLTPHVGRMLEIKCPLMRKIQYVGSIKDTICPIYYWCQIQQQLECLDLDECDFVQCNIERYNSRQDWIDDTHPEFDFKSKKYGLPRGIIIELIPIKLSECDYNEKGYYADMTIWTKTKCLYPSKIDMTFEELDEWVFEQLSNIDYGYTLHKIIYWRLIEQNCTLILRNKEWFNSQLPVYNKIWDYVVYLRNNLDVAEKWKEWIDGLVRKYNDKIMSKLDELIMIKKNS